MSELHVEISGSGRPLVLLHGWGMHAGVFRSLSEQLARRHTILAVDLPGHGESVAFAQFAELPRLSEYCMQQLGDVLHGAAILVGWSLGGLLAQYMAAQYPEAVEKLVLFCSTPCFRRREDWPHAVDDAVLSRFAADLSGDTRGTISRFLALQFMGTHKEKENLREARRMLFARPMADVETLQQGLQLLRRWDLRESLQRIRCPTLVINGEYDRLVPTTVMPYLAEQINDARGVIIRGAGHAPFLIQPAMVNRFMERFIHEY